MLTVYMVEDKDGDTIDGWFDDDKQARRVAIEVGGVLVAHQYAFVSSHVIEDYTDDDEPDESGVFKCHGCGSYMTRQVDVDAHKLLHGLVTQLTIDEAEKASRLYSWDQSDGVRAAND